MDKKLFFIFIITTFFITNYQTDKGKSFKTFHKKNKNNFFLKPDKKTKKSPYLMAYLWGDKSKLGSKEKKSFKILGVSHLLTPSGLHFTTIIAFLSLPFFIFKKLRPLKILIEIILCLAILFLGQHTFYSLKRMASFRLLAIINTPFKAFSTFSLFMITFILDFFLGTYSHSPLSFIYSFLFFGTILANKDRPLFFSLFFAQLLIAGMLEDGLAFFSLYLNPLVTCIFTFLYPAIFLTNLVNLTQLSEKICFYFTKLVTILGDLALNFSYFKAYFLYTLSSFIYSLSFIKNKRSWSYMTLFLTFLIPTLLSDFPLPTIESYIHRSNYL